MIVQIGQIYYFCGQVGNSRAFVRSDCVEVIRHIFANEIYKFYDLDIILQTLKQQYKQPFYLVDNICIKSSTYKEVEKKSDKEIQLQVKTVNTLRQTIDNQIIISGDNFNKMYQEAFAIIHPFPRPHIQEVFIKVPVRLI